MKADEKVVNAGPVTEVNDSNTFDVLYNSQLRGLLLLAR